jgi:hypothetical protein
VPPRARARRRGARVLARPALAAAWPIALALAGVACRLPTIGIPVWVQGGAISEQELRNELLGYASRFTVIVNAAAEQISEGSADPQIRRRSVLWRLRMPPLAREAASPPDPRRGYALSLAVAVAMRQYFSEGEGREMFAAAQPLAVEASQAIENDVLSIGAKFLSEERLADLGREVERAARENPIRGTFLREDLAAGLASTPQRSRVTALMDVPMAPFRAVSGVESGAQAIHEFNGTAAQFVEVVDELPERVRLQLELMRYDLQEPSSPLSRGLDAFESVAGSAELLSQTAAQLPAELRGQVQDALGRIEQSEDALRRTLVDYRAALADTSGTISGAQELAAQLSRFAEHAEGAGQAWRDAVTEARRESQDREPGRPFDVLEYERTAAQVASAARDLRALVAELGELEGARLAGLLDRAALLAAGLIVVFFALLLAYRVVTARMSPGTRG